MFGICISQLISNLALLISTAYLMINKGPNLPSRFQETCSGIGLIYSAGDISSVLYNTVFCVVLSMSLGRTLKGGILNRIGYHLVVLLSVISITVPLAVQGLFGLSIRGICGYKALQQIVRLIIQLIIVFVCFVGMYVFGTKIPKNSYFKKVSVFGYYYYYMGLYSSIQLLTTVGYLTSFAACRDMKL
jgi:hypothetical protein